MNKHRTLTGIAVLAIAATMLTGCASNGYTSSGDRINVVQVDLPDGRHVVCVNVSSSVDCDWDGATK